MNVRAVLVALLPVLLLPHPCRAQEAVASFGPPDAETRLLVRSTTDIGIFAPTIEAFLETAPGIAIDYEQWGSNNLFALSAAECDSGAPEADMVISSGVHQMVKLVNDLCAEPHSSDETALLPPELRWRDEIWGISREPAVMVYNRNLVPPDEVPRTRFDLLDLLRPSASRYSGRVATYDIEASGLGFLFAFLDSQEATTFGSLLEALGRSGAVATCCSAEIIDGVARGDYYIAYNVLGSYARIQAEANPDLGIAFPEDYTLVLSRAAILPRRPHVAPAARRFLDFVLSTQGQVALRRSHLTLEDAEGEDSDYAGPSASISRFIELTPALLVPLDRQKRIGFIDRWRATFAE